MRRLYFMADNVEDAGAICAALRHEGISDWHLHVLAKDEAGLYTHKIHSANPLIHQLDVVHTGARFALVGAGVGLALGLIAWSLSSAGVLSLPIGGFIVLALTLLGLCFGAWEGGMVGLTREHYKIERFHSDIEAGKYLLMVDVSRAQRPLVKEVMNFDFPHVPFRGGTSTGINVMDKPGVLYHQNTH